VNTTNALLTIDDLAIKLNVTKRAIRDWIFRGKLNSTIVRAGRLIRFDAEKVNEKIKGGNILD
jgi:excisionase family DNA binding protein